ncbi:MAG: enoyl-CoA hydratase/isomerase family protein [SAR324 cluster bacterium]|nr:enoyl-CoA hydratase/isomerase family protein [SAR324 cluster bacterium]
MKPYTDKVIAEKEDHIGWLTFNNPERRNAISLEMWQAIPECISEFEADTQIRIIVLKGAGDKAFVAGADISEFEKQRSSKEKVEFYEQQTEAASKSLAEASKPTIAMIRGFCVGGGVGIALNCDMRIATENSQFAVPAAKLGLGYRYGGLKTLVDLVGPSFAKEIFYTARLFSASEALAMGLVNRVTANEHLEEYVRDYCKTISRNAPLTVKSVKKIVREIVSDQGPDLELCTHAVKECFDSEDYIEGRNAFMEKRFPVFQGR